MTEFGCNWIGPNDALCPRAAGKTGYCRWHTMARRLESIWQQHSPATTADSVVLVALFVLTGKFYVHGVRHAQALWSGKYAAEFIGHNPFFTPLLLGFALMYMGKVVSAGSKDKSAVVRSRYLIPLAVGCLIAGITLLSLPGVTEGTRPEMFGWIFLALPLVWMIAWMEIRWGMAAAITVLVGLVLVLGAGLCNPVMESLHQSIGGFDYLPPLEPAIRKVHANDHVGMGIVLTAAACDAIIALCFTGQLITPFGKKGLRIFEERPDDTLLGAVSRSVGRCLALALVIIGQGYVLRFALWSVFHGFLLDFLPYYSYWYAAIALGIHYAVSQMRGETADDDATRTQVVELDDPAVRRP